MKYLSIILLIMGYTLSYSQPQIQIEGNDVYDWGKINPKGKPLTAKVRIYNKGNEILKITEVKPGCGCTTAPLDKNEIEPNGYATLDITLNVNNDGPVHKSIRISSNDIKNPNKNLALKADIVRPIGVSRRFVNFGDIEIGMEKSENLILKNNTKKDITINKIILEPNDLKINLKEKEKLLSQKEFNLEIKFIPKNDSNLSGKITLITDNEDMKNVEISIWGKNKNYKK